MRFKATVAGPLATLAAGLAALAGAAGSARADVFELGGNYINYPATLLLQEATPVASQIDIELRYGTNNSNGWGFSPVVTPAGQGIAVAYFVASRQQVQQQTGNPTIEGYHGVINGIPYVVLGMAYDRDDQYVMSHEFIETEVDPYVNYNADGGLVEIADTMENGTGRYYTAYNTNSLAGFALPAYYYAGLGGPKTYQLNMCSPFTGCSPDFATSQGNPIYGEKAGQPVRLRTVLIPGQHVGDLVAP